jgi:hypothetical protein
MRSIAWIAAPFFLAAPFASAEIFKCAGKDGVVVYQNFRCEIESLGSLPSQPARAGGSALALTAQPESAKKPSEPRVGMTTEEVRGIWGEPTDTFNDEPRTGGRSEVWVYGSNRSVRFDQTSRVMAVEKQGGS